MSERIDVYVGVNDRDASSKFAKLERVVYEFKRDAETPINIRMDTTTVKDAEGKVKKLVETARYASGEIEAVTKKANKVTATTKTEKDNADAIERRMRNLDAYMRLREQVAANEERASLKESAAAKRSAQEQEQAHRKKMQSLQEQMRLSETIERTTNKAASLYAKGDMQGYQAAIQYLKELGVAVDEAAIKEKALQSAAQGAGKATEDAGKRSEEAANRANKASKSFGLLHTIFLRLAHTAISRMTRAFRQAFTEMQNVDKQLTTVSRITQTSISNLDGLKEKAYEVGSAYGVMASDYLSGVAAFTRAGYREQAEDLAELSTKLQVAGEVSAETANQLLIATDKAYGLNGSVTKLSSVMDKMTYVDHNYATSVEKIAEGMGIVAPVAAQAHMSVDELIASLGTITAVTQRSGSESARALRALILSILKDTTTELEDGVTMTVEEVNSVQDALKKYAPEVVAAAEATGELIDPMEAIAALSKSFKEGILTEQKLAEITNSLGGKLRASQLLSLIQNYSGMYSDMIKGMGDSLGIVDKDMERYLESWQGKLNQLKNSFAGFTESILDTDAVKGFIDALNYLIQAIDNPDEYADKFASAFESAIQSISGKHPKIQSAITGIAFMLVKSLMSALSDEMPSILESITEGARYAADELVKELPDIMENVMNVIGTLVMDSIINGGIAQEIGTSIAFAIVEAIPNALTGLSDAFNNAIYNGDFTLASTNDGYGGLEAIMKLLGLGGAQKTAYKYGIMLGEKLRKGVDDGMHGGSSTDETHGGHSGKFGSDDFTVLKPKTESDSLERGVKDLSKAFETLGDKVSSATKRLNEYKKALEDSGEKGDELKSYAEAYNKAVELFGKGLTGTNAFTSAIDLLFTPEQMRELGWNYEKAGEMLSKPFFKALFESGGEDFGANAANYIHTHQDEFEGVVTKVTDGKLSLMVTDMDAFAKSAEVSADALYVFLKALGAYNSAAEYTREELLGLVNASDDGSGVVINLSDAINKLASDGKSEREIHQIIGAIQELAETDPTIQLEGSADGIDEIIDKINELHDESENEDAVHVDVESDVDEEAERINSVLDEIDGRVLTVHVVADYKGFNGGAGSNYKNQTQMEYASGTDSAKGGIALVNDGGGAELISANGKAWIAGGGEPTLTNLPQGATVFNAKQTREILSRSGIPAFKDGTGWIGGIPVTTASGGKVNLKNIEAILDELSKYIDKILKKAKEALDKQLKEIDAQIDALEREHNAEEDKNKLEELRLKILEAEKKLAEAENERTVRYFNKETGQWEWMADQKAVADAQKALQEAQEAYDKELAEQEYQAQIQALKDLKEALQGQYDELAEHWQEILNAIKESGEEEVDFEAILKKLGLDSDTTGSIRELIQAIQDYEKKLADGTYEVPLDSATAERLLGVSGITTRGDSTLSQMFGMTTADMSAKGTSLYNTSNTSSVYGDTYYINGIKIGSDMLNMTLSQLLSVLPIYANAN